MSYSPLHSKVVLDPLASQALLAMAYQEELLTESKDNDMCLQQLASRNYPGWLKVQALEQVVLFEQVHMALRFAWRGVHGMLVEEGPFYPIDEPLKPNGVIQEIDSAILNGILKARGISPTPFEDPSILLRVEQSLHALKQWEEKYGETAPSSLSVTIDRIFKRQPNLEPKYAELEELRAPLKEFEPIASALETYLETLTTAQDRSAFAMAPIYESPSQNLFNPIVTNADINIPTVLLRLTCTKLGVLPHGQSLSETLKIARDPATVALRSKIQEWTVSLTNDAGADTERIQREIRDALQHLESARIGSTISNITTYLGLPLALLAPVSRFAEAMGWICNVAGTIGLSISDATAASLRWASFGSTKKI